MVISILPLLNTRLLTVNECQISVHSSNCGHVLIARSFDRARTSAQSLCHNEILQECQEVL